MRKQSGDMTWTVRVIRGLFVLACIIMGAIWAGYFVEEMTGKAQSPSSPLPWLAIGGAIGCGLALVVLFLLHFITQQVYERIAPALVAIVLALVMGYFAGQYILFWFPDSDVNLRIFVVVTLVLLFGFGGITLGLTRASSWDALVTAVERGSSTQVPPKLVDTSVLIDGRIADICATGFVDGKLLVPRFVLRELQNIADSSDVLRRAKGRRGLDILKNLQERDGKVMVEIIEEDPKEIPEVDGKLVRLAAMHGGKILTTDFNLNKVAQIEGIAVLNINDLANALKPAVLPDEQMQVKIIKEGKEPSQGVGYLDDGTMIVVDGGRVHMGKKVEVLVTSVLQTAAGRMIFGKFSSVV